MEDKIGTDEYGKILIYQTDDGQTNICLLYTSDAADEDSSV